MKKIISFLSASLTALFLCPRIAGAAAGGQLIVDTYMPIPPEVAYSSTFSIRADGIDWAAAQVVVTSVTQANQTFTDGSAATGTLTVVTATALTSATATGTSMKISSDTALVGQCVSGGGIGLGQFNVCNPGQWAVDLLTSSNTACNIAAAIQKTGVVLSTCAVNNATGLIYSTAPTYGSVWNGFAINSSTLAALSSSTFSGGQDNQNFSINGVTLLANRDWFPTATAAGTADSIVAAINANASLSPIIISTDTGSLGVVYASATSVGVGGNYGMTTSSNPALTIALLVSSSPVNGSGIGTMSGGTNAAYTINTATIATTASENLGTGEGVYFTTSSNVGIAPLTYNTTYYIIDLPVGFGVQLATTQANAIAGLPIILTSSRTNSPADSFTLNVPAIAGTPSVTWAASNDNTHWLPFTQTPFNITLPTISYGSYFSTGTVTNFDFGHYDYSYLGLNVTAPTAGAINILAHVVGNAP